MMQIGIAVACLIIATWWAATQMRYLMEVRSNGLDSVSGTD